MTNEYLLSFLNPVNRAVRLANLVVSFGRVNLEDAITLLFLLTI